MKNRTKVPEGWRAEVRFAKAWRQDGSLATIMHETREEAQRMVDDDPRYLCVVRVVVMWNPHEVAKAGRKLTPPAAPDRAAPASPPAL